MTPAELIELKKRLEAASPEDIGFIFKSMGFMSPFEDRRNSLLLPSMIKARAIAQIEKWFKTGALRAQKNA